MYEKFKSMYPSFSKGEAALWAASVTLIVVSFFIFGAKSILTLTASLIGVTALIFNAKGNPAGQFLMIVFSILYGVISYSYAYYGEMITYLGMTTPMALFALVAWLRHPYNGNKAEVQVNRLTGKETVFMAALTAVVTVVFYFLLAAFHTANLLLSTISVTTSFLAVYLTFRAKRPLRNCLRGKRYCIDFSMDVGGAERSFICVGNHMFCHVFGK